MKITRQRLKEIIKEELENNIDNIDEGLFDQDGILAFLNPNNWADPFGIQSYFKDRDKKRDADAKAKSKEEKAAAAKVQQHLDARRQKWLNTLPDMLKKRAQAFARNDYSMRGIPGAPAELPERAGIKYSAPLAVTMFDVALGLGLIVPGNETDEEAYSSFVKQFESSKEFADKVLAGMKPSIREIGIDAYHSLVDYGQGFGPKAKDGTPFDKAGLREGNMKITKQRLKEIIAEELTKSEKARKKELEKELDDLKHK